MDNIKIFTAIITKFADDDYNVRFPDFEEINTFGSTFEEAYLSAEEALEFCIFEKISENEEIPMAIKANDITIESNQRLIIVKINLVEVLKKYDNSSIKKTLTIPSWLNNLAEQNNINFSQLLQIALKDKLHLDN